MAVNCDPFGSELHGLGSSINCLGRRVASYTTRDAKEIAKLLAMVSFLCFIVHKSMGVQRVIYAKSMRWGALRATTNPENVALPCGNIRQCRRDMA